MITDAVWEDIDNDSKKKRFNISGEIGRHHMILKIMDADW
jgi:hypothetical protein